MRRPVAPCPCDLTAPPPVRLGQRIRELRVDAELTLEELALRMDSYRPIVGRIERGKHSLSLPVLERVAEALELDVPTITVVLDDQWCEEALEASDSPWCRYERRKALLAEKACSAAEYEAGLALIAEQEGV